MLDSIDHAAIIRFHMENTRRREQAWKEEQDDLRKVMAKAKERPITPSHADPRAAAAAASARRRQQMLANRLEDSQ